MEKKAFNPRYRSLIGGLAAARKRADVSQTELANKLGKRQQYVSKYETFERRLDVVEFIDIARALNLDFAELVNAHV